MEIKDMAFAQEDYVIACRHHLHMHPELGTKEVETTKFIVQELKAAGIDEIQTFDDITGCVATIRGAHPGKTVMLRADIDALPMQEENDCAYKSQNDGVMHSCGHDCHTAMLLGAARLLVAQKENIHGTVKLLFQMAEEIGTESRHYVEKGCLDNVDALFGMHVWSWIDSGKASFEDGARMACSDRFVVTVSGKSAPAAAPQQGRDAIVAAANVVMALQGIVSRLNAPENSLVVTVGMMNGGSSALQLADKVELVGTVRTFDKKFRDGMPEMIQSVAQNAAAAYGCTADCAYTFGPSPLINEHQDLNELARGAVTKIMGEGALTHLEKMTGAEDFSVLMEKVPGVYGYLGVRNLAKNINCAHHHPLFRVDEEQFKYGCGVYAQFALDYLEQNK